MRLLPRQDGQTKGLIDEFSIELSDDGRAWHHVIDGRFNGAKEHIAEFRARLAKLHNNFFQGFAAVTLKAAKEHPEVFGLTAAAA